MLLVRGRDRDLRHLRGLLVDEPGGRALPASMLVTLIYVLSLKRGPVGPGEIHKWLTNQRVTIRDLEG